MSKDAMTDAVDHFVDFHRQDDPWGSPGKGVIRMVDYVKQLGERTAALEAALVKLDVRVSLLEEEVCNEAGDTAMALTKQRAVNEILLRYNDDDPVLSAALRETLK